MARGFNTPPAHDHLRILHRVPLVSLGGLDNRMERGLGRLGSDGVGLNGVALLELFKEQWVHVACGRRDVRRRPLILSVLMREAPILRRSLHRHARLGEGVPS